MKERGSIVAEEYLQAIYSLQASGEPVKSIALSKWLKCSPSTVHATVSRLHRDKLVRIKKNKEICLTDEGFQKAESLMRRHRLVEQFLYRTLGISWHEVHQHAHVMEHGLTPLVEEKLAEFLEFPSSCPHGTPIPGNKNPIPKETKGLDEFLSGDRIQIIFIGESLEESFDLLKLLQEKSVLPGTHHLISEKTDITKTIVLQNENSSVTLPYDIAGKIGAIKC